MAPPFFGALEMEQKIKHQSNAQDYTGARFGRLVVIGEDHPRKYGKYTQRVMICRCDCGEIKTVQLKNLRAGTTQSCGCLRRERMKLVLKPTDD